MTESGSNSPSYCGQCGRPLSAGERFCSNCGSPVGPSGTDARQVAPAASSTSPMVFVGAAMILLAVLAVVGIVFFGDRLGLSGSARDQDPPRLLGESTTPEDSSPESTPEPQQNGEPEDTPQNPEPEDDPPAYSEPDPDFAPLIPTLQQMTDAPILLPGSLPENFGGVAIDETTAADSYDILFFAEEQQDTVQPFVNAYVGATISVEPGEVVPVDYGGSGTTTRLDDATLPDGTTATVEYTEAPEAANNNIVATGRFVRDDANGDPYTYVVTVEFDSPDAAQTRELLTSMVSVEDPVQGLPAGETAEQEFITRYYDAVATGDWYTTYSLLDSSSQAEFTEAEWVEAQEARVAATAPPTLTDATLQDISGEGGGFTGQVLLTYLDGTSETVAVQTVLEDGEFRRYLTAEDVSYLRSLVGDAGDTGESSGTVAAVEEFVYEYYDAVAAEDWSATYSMLDYGGQSAFTEAEWIERQELRQATLGAPSTVVDVSVSVPDYYPPVATATVTFASGEVVEISVADPHAEDGQLDRVLTDEEIAYLNGL